MCLRENTSLLAEVMKQSLELEFLLVLAENLLERVQLLALCRLELIGRMTRVKTTFQSHVVHSIVFTDHFVVINSCFIVLFIRDNVDEYFKEKSHISQKSNLELNCVVIVY